MPSAVLLSISGSNAGNSAAITTLVSKNAMTTYSTLPRRNPTITGAAVAVGVMPAKNAASAMSCFPVNQPMPNPTKPISKFASNKMRWLKVSDWREKRICKKVMNNIAMISQRTNHANADACGKNAPPAKALTMAKVRNNPGCMN